MNFIEALKKAKGIDRHAIVYLQGDNHGYSVDRLGVVSIRNCTAQGWERTYYAGILPPLHKLEAQNWTVIHTPILLPE